MEIVTILKDLASVGFTPPALIALGALYQFQKIINAFDRRLVIVETVVQNNNNQSTL